jgi:CIC family chloride channel protein
VALARLKTYVQSKLQSREDQVFLALAIVIGVQTGAVVAFILVTERAGMRLYPPHAARWRRLAFPLTGSIVVGYLLIATSPSPAAAVCPQTKAALYASEGRITLRTIIGKFPLHLSHARQRNPSRPRGVGPSSPASPVLGRNLGLRPEKVSALIPVGAAAPSPPYLTPRWPQCYSR